METKFTKGEWKALFSDLTDQNWIQADNRNIALINGGEYDTTPMEEAKANSKLIAAAPELLAAVQRFIAFVDKQGLEYESSMIREAKAAIKKATE